MVSEMNQTPKALRLHIGVFGDTNAGKSTLINTISEQEVALTSPVAGTTTDPVFKPMELLPLGPVVLIDTAGLNDSSELGSLRIQKTTQQIKLCDCAILVISSQNVDVTTINNQLQLIKTAKIPIILVINQIDGEDIAFDFGRFQLPFCKVNLHCKESAGPVKKLLISTLQDKIEDICLTKDFVQPGDTVILVVPQDIQAPKGRLILPQVQIIRDLLDNDCMVLSVTTNRLRQALQTLNSSPSLVITDSQLYKAVSKILPENIRLTSFSILMARSKGDIFQFVAGARAIDRLENGDTVMILESCAHHAMHNDIAREQIPELLQKYTKKQLNIIMKSGQQISDDLTDVKLAIHCGGCMVNRKAMLEKQKHFEQLGIPMTNFGVAIAYMNGVFDRVYY